MINCVGPYTESGEKVVQACIHGGCHYVDITGEPNFVFSIISKFHRKAQEKGYFCHLTTLSFSLPFLQSFSLLFLLLSVFISFMHVGLIPSPGIWLPFTP